MCSLFNILSVWPENILIILPFHRKSSLPFFLNGFIFFYFLSHIYLLKDLLISVVFFFFGRVRS